METKTGNLAAPRFSAFLFRRRGAHERLRRDAPRARCDQSCARCKPGGVILASEAFFAPRFPSTPLREVWQGYFLSCGAVSSGHALKRNNCSRKISSRSGAAHDQERLFAQDSTRVGQTLPFRQVSFGGGIFWIGAQNGKLKPVLLYKHAFAELVAADEHLGRAIAAEQIRNLAILKNALRLKRAGCRN